MSQFRRIDAHPERMAALRTLRGALVAVAGIALGGCVAYPPPQGPILSRLPEQAGAQQEGSQQTGSQQAGSQRPYAPSAAPAATPQNLTPGQLWRYNEIDRQVLREQDQAMRNEAAARAWSRVYSYAAPVSVYGSYYSGGWGHGWGVGTGWGYAPGYGW
jgi:hypothetical protein